MKTKPTYNYRHKLISPNALCGSLEKTAYPMSKLNKLFRQHIELNRLVAPLVLQHASVQANVARYQQGILSLSVENHSTANHLRYVSPVLLAELVKYPEFFQLTDITVFVLPNNFAQQTSQPNRQKDPQKNKNTAHTAQPLSAQTKMSISNLANRHIKHEKLKQALLALAETVKD